MRDIVKAIHKPGMLVQDLGGEMLLYSAEEKVMHILNPTARRIWELCDGEHTIGDMEQAMRASFAVAEEYDVVGDIRRTLAVFVEKKLMQMRT